MNQWCKVCDEPAAGFHFGAFTCEGCKSFFGRAHTNPTAAFDCKTGGGRCVIDKKNRTSCKACRLKKCLAVGMSKSGSRYGRRSNWFKIHCLLQHRPRPLPREIDRDDRCGGRDGDDDDDDDDGGDGEDGRYSDPMRPRAARLSSSVPQMMPYLLFGFTPKSRAPLPWSEHSAFRATVKSDDGAAGHFGDRDDDDDDDRPIDLTVRQNSAEDDDDDDDNNNETTGKYDLLRLHEHNCTDPAAPLDLTRSVGRKFGVRS